MEFTEAQHLVGQLTTGFDTLQQEYQKLAGRHQALERQLETARTQYNELAKLCGSASLATPPLSLTSASGIHHHDPAEPSASDLIGSNGHTGAEQAASRVRDAQTASQRLSLGFTATQAPDVLIWSGSSAEVNSPGRCMMPSITESPLEQDFTVEGTPSKLGCPFASMTGRPLSSHAASVLSRYKSGGSVMSPAESVAPESVNRTNGRVSFSSRRASRRGSIADPIKAEICGLSDHRDADRVEGVVGSSNVVVDPAPAAAEAGVCPIRFLDQHSPEEVATYFEKHKHELPRSHELCVKRYQTNEAQIRELDSKYGNLVSMIQGLGAKHQPMLPQDPDEAVEEEDGTALDDEEADKVRKWASNVSLAPMEALRHEGGQTNEQQDVATGEDSRQSHFERLRDIRVGESPSRPWGISVPSRFIEKAEAETGTNNPPVVNLAVAEHSSPPVHHEAAAMKAINKPPSAAKCPFDFSKMPSGPLPGPDVPTDAKPVKTAATVPLQSNPAVAFIAPNDGPGSKHEDSSPSSQQRMVFTGPVFVGYSAEDAVKILRESGFART